MLKSTLVVLFVLSFFLFLSYCQATNVLTCLPATNASASAVLGATTPDVQGDLNSLFSVAVNAAGTYVFVLYNNAVYRYPFDPTTGVFNTSARVRIGRRPVDVNGTCIVERRTICIPYTLTVDSLDRLWITDNSLKRVVRYNNVSTAVYTGKIARPKAIVGAASWTVDLRTSTVVDGFNLAGPADSAYYASTDTLYILDTDGATSRVLRYDLVSQQPIYQVSPQGVLGQTNTTVLVSTSASAGSIGAAEGINVDQNNGDLYVADGPRNRVLRWENASYKANGADADYVIGQPNFTSTTASVTQNTLSNPTAISFDAVNDVAFITDRDNNRTVVYGHASEQDDQPTFDLVIGQANFVTGTGNQGQVLPSENTLLKPYQTIYNNATGYTFVADTTNQRVLAFGPCTVAISSPGATPSSAATVSISASIGASATNTQSIGASAAVSPSIASTVVLTTTTGGSTGSTGRRTTTTGGSTGSTGLRRR